MSSSDGRPGRSASSNGTGKAAAAAPQVTAEDVEMSNVQAAPPPPSLPLEDDIMQCARLGETGLIQKMFDSGKFKPSYKDEEGITPLHWAAINNQYATCKYLIETGADVNAKGGESYATPAMWAAQRCHYYIVHLLLNSGADPLLVDGQGYNILHLATIDGNAFLVVLLLHQEIPVDVVDPQQHTSLMWAAYKGYPALVDLLLRWGANVNARDDKGLTPLHWALVKGSQGCIQKILEFGGDRFAETDDGKNPHVVAQEMRSTRMWHRALAECGYDTNGQNKVLPFGLSTFTRNEKFMIRFFFLWPFLSLFLLITALSSYVIYIGVPLALGLAWFTQWIAQKVGQLGPGKFRNLHHTPYLAGWFAASLFYVGARWAYWILPVTFTSNTIMNIFFAGFYGLTTYFFSISAMEDPGFVPRLSSRNKEKETIDELFSLWKFDEDNFCLQCMIRKPLRSKHCRRCGKCVAKHDHHCPWINNCVGANNHRHFLLYTLALEGGIIFFLRLVIAHLEQIPEPTNAQCTFLSKQLCGVYDRDPWTLTLAGWSTLQLFWVIMLSVVQLVQVSRNETTQENMKRHRMDDMPSNASRAITAALAAGTTSPSAAGLTSTGMGPTATVGSGTPPPKKQGCMKRWSRLIGLDTFIATARGGLGKEAGQSGRRQRATNPFSRGVITNCRDFWCDPAPIFGFRTGTEGMLGGQVVNYARMYDVPRMTTGAGGMVYTSLTGEIDPNDHV